MSINKFQILAELHLDSGPYRRGVNEAVAGLKQLDKAHDSVNAKGAAGSAAGGFKFNKEIRDRVDILKQAASQQRVLNGLFDKGSATQKRYLSSLSGLRRGLKDFNAEAAETLIIQERAGKIGITTLDGAGNAMKRFQIRAFMASQYLDGLATRVTNLGKNAQWTGRQLMVGVTAPILGIGAVAVKSAMDVERLNVTMSKVTGSSFDDSALKRLDEQSIQLSESLGLARKEIKQMQIDFARVGFSELDVTRATELASQLSLVGDIELPDSQELIRMLRQVSDLSGEDAWADITDQVEKFNAIDDKTNMTLKDTAANLKEIYPITRQFGSTASETAALMAAITQGGFDAGEAARTLRQALSKLPTALANVASDESGGAQRLKFLTDQLKELNDQTGMDLSLYVSGTENVKKDAVEILNTFGAALSELNKRGDSDGYNDFLKTLRSIFVGERMSEGRQLVEAIGKSMDSATASGQDYAKALEIAGEEGDKWSQKWANEMEKVSNMESTQIRGQLEGIKNKGIELGTKLLPVATKLVTKIGDLVDKFFELSPGIQDFLLKALGGFAAVGPVIYAMAMPLVAFGTTLKGLSVPLKAFFNIAKKNFSGISQIGDEGMASIIALQDAFKKLDPNDPRRVDKASAILDILTTEKSAINEATAATKAQTAATIEKNAAQAAGIETAQASVPKTPTPYGLEQIDDVIPPAGGTAAAGAATSGGAAVAETLEQAVDDAVESVGGLGASPTGEFRESVAENAARIIGNDQLTVLRASGKAREELEEVVAERREQIMGALSDSEREYVNYVNRSVPGRDLFGILPEGDKDIGRSTSTVPGIDNFYLEEIRKLDDDVNAQVQSRVNARKEELIDARTAQLIGSEDYKVEDRVKGDKKEHSKKKKARLDEAIRQAREEVDAMSDDAIEKASRELAEGEMPDFESPVRVEKERLERLKSRITDYEKRVGPLPVSVDDSIDDAVERAADYDRRTTKFFDSIDEGLPGADFDRAIARSRGGDPEELHAAVKQAIESASEVEPPVALTPLDAHTRKQAINPIKELNQIAEETYPKDTPLLYTPDMKKEMRENLQMGPIASDVFKFQKEVEDDVAKILDSDDPIGELGKYKARGKRATRKATKDRYRAVTDQLEHTFRVQFGEHFDETLAGIDAIKEIDTEIASVAHLSDAQKAKLAERADLEKRRDDLTEKVQKWVPGGKAHKRDSEALDIVQKRLGELESDPDLKQRKKNIEKLKSLQKRRAKIESRIEEMKKDFKVGTGRRKTLKSEVSQRVQTKLGYAEKQYLPDNPDVGRRALRERFPVSPIDVPPAPAPELDMSDLDLSPWVEPEGPELYQRTPRREKSKSSKPIAFRDGRSAAGINLNEIGTPEFTELPPAIDTLPDAEKARARNMGKQDYVDRQNAPIIKAWQESRDKARKEWEEKRAKTLEELDLRKLTLPEAAEPPDAKERAAFLRKWIREAEASGDVRSYARTRGLPDEMQDTLAEMVYNAREKGSGTSPKRRGGKDIGYKGMLRRSISGDADLVDRALELDWDDPRRAEALTIALGESLPEEEFGLSILEDLAGDLAEEAPNSRPETVQKFRDAANESRANAAGRGKGSRRPIPKVDRLSRNAEAGGFAGVDEGIAGADRAYKNESNAIARDRRRIKGIAERRVKLREDGARAFEQTKSKFQPRIDQAQKVLDEKKAALDEAISSGNQRSIAARRRAVSGAEDKLQAAKTTAAQKGFEARELAIGKEKRILDGEEKRANSRILKAQKRREAARRARAQLKKQADDLAKGVLPEDDLSVMDAAMQPRRDSKGREDLLGPSTYPAGKLDADGKPIGGQLIPRDKVRKRRSLERLAGSLSPEMSSSLEEVVAEGATTNTPADKARIKKVLARNMPDIDDELQEAYAERLGLIARQMEIQSDEIPYLMGSADMPGEGGLTPEQYKKAMEGRRGRVSTLSPQYQAGEYDENGKLIKYDKKLGKPVGLTDEVATMAPEARSSRGATDSKRMVEDLATGFGQSDDAIEESVRMRKSRVGMLEGINKEIRELDDEIRLLEKQPYMTIEQQDDLLDKKWKRKSLAAQSAAYEFPQVEADLASKQAEIDAGETRLGEIDDELRKLDIEEEEMFARHQKEVIEAGTYDPELRKSQRGETRSAARRRADLEYERKGTAGQVRRSKVGAGKLEDRASLLGDRIEESRGDDLVREALDFDETPSPTRIQRTAKELAEDKMKETKRGLDALDIELDKLDAEEKRAKSSFFGRKGNKVKKKRRDLLAARDIAQANLDRAQGELDSVTRTVVEATDIDGKTVLFEGMDEYEATRRRKVSSIVDKLDLSDIEAEEKAAILRALDDRADAADELVDLVDTRMPDVDIPEGDGDRTRRRGIIGRTLDRIRGRDPESGSAMLPFLPGRRRRPRGPETPDGVLRGRGVAAPPNVPVGTGYVGVPATGDFSSLTDNVLLNAADDGVEKGAKKPGILRRAAGRAKGAGKAAVKGPYRKKKGGFLNPVNIINMINPLKKMDKAAGGAGKSMGALGAATEGAGSGFMTLFASGGGMGAMLVPLMKIVAVIAVIALAVGFVMLMQEKWKETAQTGINRIKDAWEKLKGAFQPLVDLFKSWINNFQGEKAEGGFFDQLGEIIGWVLDMLARFINYIMPAIKIVVAIISAALNIIVNIVKAVVAVVTGEWGDAADAMNVIWQSLWWAVKTVLGETAKFIIKIFGTTVTTALDTVAAGVDKLGGLLEKLPGIDSIDWGDDIRGFSDGIDAARDKVSDTIDNWIGDAPWKKDAEKKGEETGEDMSDGVQDGLDNNPVEPTIDGDAVEDEASDAAKDYVSNFISAFQSQMRKIVDGWKKAALDAFDEYTKGLTDGVQERIDAIDDEIEAERKRDEDLEYLRRKEELRERRRAQMIRFQNDHDLAIYEGRYDDAKQLRYDHGQEMQDIDEEEDEIEQDREKQMLDRQRDFEKQQLDLRKENIEKLMDARREQLEAELNMMTEYIPKNVAEAKRMQESILGKMMEYTNGYGFIGASQASIWKKGWTDAFGAAKKQVAEEAYWTGDAAMKYFAHALGIDPDLIDSGTNRPSSPGSDTGQSTAANNPGYWVGDWTQYYKPKGPDHLTGYRHSGGTVGAMDSGNPYDVPVTLQSGEYVIQRKAVQKLGKPVMDIINEGEIPEFHTGGIVGSMKDRMREVSAASMIRKLHSAANNFVKGGRLRIGDSTYSGEDYKKAMQAASSGVGALADGAWVDKLGNPVEGGVAPGEYAAGIHPELYRRYKAWNEALGNKFSVLSGWRTMARQAELKRTKGKMAGRPGASMHNYGLAIDVSPSSTTAGERALGARFGLTWPMLSPGLYEPWHLQPVEAHEWRDILRNGGYPTLGKMDFGDSGGLRLREGFIKSAMSYAVSELGQVTEGAGAVKAIVKAVMKSMGWGEDQWPYLDRLVTKESGWNPKAANPTSSARGLFQKMTSIHGPVEGSVEGQAMWGLNYIKNRYGSPAAALAFHNANNWYHRGGLIFPEMMTGGAVVEEGIAKVHQGETVLTKQLTDALTANGNVGGGNVDIDLHFDGGFFGTDRDLRKLQEKLESDIIPQIQRSKGQVSNRFGGTT